MRTNLSAIYRHRALFINTPLPDAMDGKISAHPSEKTLKFYKLYIALSPFESWAISCLLLLSFFEKPAWCAGLSPDPCQNPLYPRWPLPVVGPALGYAIEAACLTCLLVAQALKLRYQGYTAFTRDWASVVIFLAGVLSIFDLGISLVTHVGAVRLALYLRAVIFVASNQVGYSRNS